MQLTEGALTRWLEAAGTTAESESPDDRHAVEHAFREEIGRVPGRPTVDELLGLLASGASMEQIRQRLRSSLEHFWQANRDDSASHVYRALAAQGDEQRASVAPHLIAECISTYRVLLGRDPDIDGFRTFVKLRATRSLPDIAGGIGASAEAQRHFAPHSPPSPVDAALTATSMVTGLLTAVQSDITSARVERVERLVESIENQIGALSEYVKMRLDAQPQ